MRRTILYHITTLCAWIFLLGLAVPANVLGETELEIGYGAICKYVENHEVVWESTSFPSDVKKVYCFTKILGAKEPTAVRHVWYYGNTELASVELAVKTKSWRTYSSKLIMPDQTGPWHVDVVDNKGSIIETYRFDIFKKQ